MATAEVELDGTVMPNSPYSLEQVTCLLASEPILHRFAPASAAQPGSSKYFP